MLSTLRFAPSGSPLHYSLYTYMSAILCCNPLGRAIQVRPLEAERTRHAARPLGKRPVQLSSPLRAPQPGRPGRGVLRAASRPRSPACGMNRGNLLWWALRAAPAWREQCFSTRSAIAPPHPSVNPRACPASPRFAAEGWLRGRPGLPLGLGVSDRGQVELLGVVQVLLDPGDDVRLCFRERPARRQPCPAGRRPSLPRDSPC